MDVLCADAWAVGPEQVFEPERHISRGRIEAGAAGGGFRGDAGAFFVGANQQMTALFSVRKEGRVLHMEGVERAFGKKFGVGLVCRELKGIAKKIERHIGVESGSPGSAA